MKVFIVSAMLLAAAMAAPSVIDNNEEVHADGSSGGMIILARMIGNCAESGEFGSCLAVKGITALNRLARSNSIEIIPGISFERDSSAVARNGKSISENEITSTLPADSEERTGRLIDLAMQSAADFMSTHNLQVKLPSESTQELARAFEEGRGKMKKLMGPLILAIGAKFVLLIPILLGGLVLLATKALIVAKIAFFLAAAVGLQKLVGGGSSLNVLGKLGGLGGLGGLTGGQGWGASNGGWSSGGSGWNSGSSSYPYARSSDAQDLAYSAQAPTQ